MSWIGTLLHSIYSTIHSSSYSSRTHELSREKSPKLEWLSKKERIFRSKDTADCTCWSTTDPSTVGSYCSSDFNYQKLTWKNKSQKLTQKLSKVK